MSKPGSTGGGSPGDDKALSGAKEKAAGRELSEDELGGITGGTGEPPPPPPPDEGDDQGMGGGPP